MKGVVSRAPPTFFSITLRNNTIANCPLCYCFPTFDIDRTRVKIVFMIPYIHYFSGRLYNLNQLIVRTFIVKSGIRVYRKKITRQTLQQLSINQRWYATGMSTVFKLWAWKKAELATKTRIASWNTVGKCRENLAPVTQRLQQNLIGYSRQLTR